MTAPRSNDLIRCQGYEAKRSPLFCAPLTLFKTTARTLISPLHFIQQIFTECQYVLILTCFHPWPDALQAKKSGLCSTTWRQKGLYLCPSGVSVCLCLSQAFFKIFFKVFFFFFGCGPFSKSFTEFVTILLLFHVLVFWPWAMWDLSSPTRDRNHTPCIGRGPPGKFLDHQGSSLKLYLKHSGHNPAESRSSLEGHCSRMYRSWNGQNAWQSGVCSWWRVIPAPPQTYQIRLFRDEAQEAVF